MPKTQKAKTVFSSSKKIKTDKIALPVTPRTVFGKQLRKSRHEGIIPANIFGPNFASTSVSVQYRELINVYKIAKGTSVVYLQKNSEEIPVLIQNVQKHPVTDHILHVDFRKIDLKQKIVTAVPIKVIGKSEAVDIKGGVLLTQMEKLSVEALPQDIPQFIEVDITRLTEIGQEIKVADLPSTAAFIFKDEPAKVVVSAIAHKEESITPETTTIAPEVITEKVPVEGEEAAQPAKGETKEVKSAKTPVEQAPKKAEAAPKKGAQTGKQEQKK